MDDNEIREKCKKYNIKVGPITNSTRTLYLKKIANFEEIKSSGKLKSSSAKPNEEIDLSSLSKEEIASLPNDRLTNLLKQYEIYLPVSSSSKSLLAARLYQEIHQVSAMDWEP